MTRVAAGVLGGVTLTLLAGCAGINAQTNAYATLAEARQAGAVAGGWIPEGLPPGAHDLREAHVPGTPDHWGIFDYPQEQEPALRALLQPDEIPLDRLRCDIPRRIEWWPGILRGALDGTRLAATGIRAYRARDGNRIFAVNWSQGRAYYWSASQE